MCQADNILLLDIVLGTTGIIQGTFLVSGYLTFWVFTIYLVLPIPGGLQPIHTLSRL